MFRILPAFVLIVGLCGSAAAQQFSDNTSAIPTSGSANNSSTENVDFGDVDLDGDWDAVFADGGDDGQDQNRIWINQGGNQGGTVGNFIDRTSAQFPSIQQDGRDIEFVDFDDDGDLDLYSSNTSRFINQTNRWWLNQGTGSGNYIDETALRWSGLAGPGSSIANNQLIGGGFIDWSCDCDFGDMDNDGDMDLVHSSYGGAFGGDVPTRIFLNNGSGIFSEFNPSGFQLSSDQIANGNPGLWCEGTQSANTTNSNGNFCDIASSALDIDIGDIDGDFDLDILHGARQEAPRMFENRMEENGGEPTNLGFRDVTGSAFPGGYTSGSGHYEQEMADMDGDGDLDIYGLNWLSPFTDTTMRGLGNGTFDQVTTLSGSGSDDNEGDFLDYDNDGDMDLFVANFQGSDRLYRNNNNGGASFSFTNVSSGNIPGYVSFSPTSLDADAADVDNDGDYDVMIAADSFDRNVLLTNNENPASGMDNHAPYIPNLEQAPDRAAGPAPTVIRAQVYDNAPYYITWYNPTVLEYTVNGGGTTQVTMKSSGGQIFRGEIPGTLTGNICYRVISQDQYGQSGMSTQKCYDASGGFTDCNNNGVPDDQELAGNDCNSNSVPDECDVPPDCNSNGTPDVCELAGNDCNSNGTPDDCELGGNDCNSNGTPDDCELAGNDCNSNGTPDSCELAGNDCNSNGVPDECDGPDCNGNNTPDSCELAGNDCNSNGTPDDCELGGNDCNSNGTPDECDVPPDCNSNGVPDGCELGGNDCNSNGTPDDCDVPPDCNSNGVPDSCELTGNDCNSNSVPDDCELGADCNSNGMPDSCDLAGNDCNSNSTPDDCELGGNDCNSNGTPDDCELVPDCNSNGVPDECEVPPDCNSNGVPDECELGADCNSNGIPDGCDLGGNDCNSNGTPDECDSGPDCNSNGTPDECEVAGNDCNSNGTPDDCEPDCNANSVPDDCDLASGTSFDLDGDGSPDDCGNGPQFCMGDGGDQLGCTDCPCGNSAPQGTVGGCLNGNGTSGRLVGLGNPSIMNDTLRFEMRMGNPNTFAVLTSGNSRAPANAANPCFGMDSGLQSVLLDGLRCVVQGVQRHGARAMNAVGDAGITNNGWGPPSGPAGGLALQGGFNAGQTRHYQSIYREMATLVCGTGQATTQAITVTFQP